MIICHLCNYEGEKKFRQYKEMIIYKCPECNMCFQDPGKAPGFTGPSVENINNRYYSLVEPHINLDKKRLQRVKVLLSKPLLDLSVLEIGSGIGTLGFQFLSEGASYVGFEPSNSLFNISMDKFPGLKKNIFNMAYDEGIIRGRRFDLIIMIDTFEHIPYPVNFLRGLHSVLKDGGLIYIEVPNESVLAGKAVLRNLFGLYDGYPTNPGHVNLFTPPTLKKAIELAGYNNAGIYQVSVLGDRDRLRIIFNKNKLPLWVEGARLFFRLTRIDILLQQGNLFLLAQK